MDQNQVLDILRQGMWVAVKIGGPMLIASMAVGIMVAIFQAATQIHEQTLTFVPKLIVIAVILVIAGGSMLVMLQDFFVYVLDKMVAL